MQCRGLASCSMRKVHQPGSCGGGTCILMTCLLLKTERLCTRRKENRARQVSLGHSVGSSTRLLSFLTQFSWPHCWHWNRACLHRRAFKHRPCQPAGWTGQAWGAWHVLSCRVPPHSTRLLASHQGDAPRQR